MCSASVPKAAMDTQGALLVGGALIKGGGPRLPSLLGPTKGKGPKAPIPWFPTRYVTSCVGQVILNYIFCFARPNSTISL